MDAKLRTGRDALTGPPSEGEATTLARLVDVERQHILKVLQHTRWRIEGRHGAAVILGLHPSTLRSRLIRLGVLTTSAAVEIAAPQTSRRS